MRSMGKNELSAFYLFLKIPTLAQMVVNQYENCYLRECFVLILCFDTTLL